MEETLKQLEEELSSEAEGREFDKDDTKVSLPCDPYYSNASSSRGWKLGQRDDEERNGTDSTPNVHAEPACEDRAQKEKLKEHVMEMLLYSSSRVCTPSSPTAKTSPNREWSSLYHTLEAEELLQDKKSWKFVMFQDDFLSTRTERADQAFAALVYGSSPVARLFRWIFKTKAYRSSKAGNKNEEVTFLYTRKIERFQKGLLAIVSGLVLMIPVGILFLRPMDRWKCLAVVVCFGAAFIGVMVLLDNKLDKMLIGFSAYSAVLVTYDYVDKNPLFLTLLTNPFSIIGFWQTYKTRMVANARASRVKDKHHVEC
ncbi:uncharacterized protein F4812DRAFT_460747 [Daldinia caldariorum]|uniref:uncharacterized protein n=1 Tax=Daldinia caldariorum TaxID=326644 RepID=UPI002007ED2A|nr:uncharacterized protein F4812DRAFT_460747 [Daldinia caldariorum]KAI1466478.1 hypothetical protein F4812DRAFT_460747 [Daldinia caldariorum]